MPLERVGQKGALARRTGDRLGATGTGTCSKRPRSIRKHSEEGCSNLRMRPQCSRDLKKFTLSELSCLLRIWRGTGS